jgi:hypothetical protein
MQLIHLERLTYIQPYRYFQDQALVELQLSVKNWDVMKLRLWTTDFISPFTLQAGHCIQMTHGIIFLNGYILLQTKDIITWADIFLVCRPSCISAFIYRSYFWK